MKIINSLLIRLTALFFIAAIFGLVGRTIVTSWQKSKEIDQQIVDQRNPVLNKKLINQTVKKINSFQSQGLTSDQNSSSLETKEEPKDENKLNSE